MTGMGERLEVKFDADDITEKGEFTGYGAVTGNVDSYGDMIARGAFKETLREWETGGKLPPMLLQHGMGLDNEAGLPVGRWLEMEEDDRGLWVKGRLINLDTERGKGVYGAIREGVLDGLSIGYRAKEFVNRTRPDEPRRTLKSVALREVSLVTFPANVDARVAAVKSEAAIETIRDFETFLRHTGGFSHAAAKSIAAHGYKPADLRDEAEGKGADPRDEGAAELAEILRRNAAILKGE